MSEKNNNRDRFEDIFRDNLSRENLSSDTWNTPPAHIIDSALDQLEPNRNDRRLLILPVVFLFLAGLLVLWMRNDSSAPKGSPTAENEMEKRQLQDELIPRENADITSIKQKAQSEVSEVKNISGRSTFGAKDSTNPDGPQDKNQSQISTEATFAKKKDAQAQKLNDKGQYLLEKSPISDKSAPAISFAKNEDRDQAPSKKQKVLVHPPIELVLIDEWSHQTEQSVVPTAIEKSSAEAQISAWEIQLMTGAEWQRYNAKNLDLSNGHLSGHTNWSPGFNIQLKLGHSWKNKWGIEAGLGYSALENNSQYLLDVHTNDMHIQVDQFGHTHIAIEPEVKTPISEAKMSLDYIMQYANTYNPGPANFQVGIQQSLKTVQASAGLFHNFSGLSPFQWRLHSGLNYRKILSADEDMHVYVWHNDEKMIDQRANRRVSDQISTNTLEWYAGLSANYPFARQWMINARLQTNIGLTKMNTMSDQDVRQQTLQLGLGLIRKF